MPEIVNVVGAGNLGREIDVQAVAVDITAEVVRFPESNYSHRVVYLRREKSGPMATVFPSGSYHVTGAESIEEAEELKDWMGAALNDLGLDVNPTFAIKNVVLTGDLEQSVDLNHLVITLGLEETEYEPEQFPGAVYRPTDNDCVFLIFASGKVVITGSSDVGTAIGEFEVLSSQLKQVVS